MVQMTEAGSHPGEPAQSAAGSYIAQAAHGSTASVTVNQTFRAAPPRPIDLAEVAAAKALLADLSFDPLPEPTGLPPGSVLPWSHNRFFVGRQPDLLQLARQIKHGGTAGVGQSPAVTGLGGQGKTQLAVEFAFRFGRWFKGGVFWIDCSNPAAIPEAIAACGPALYPTDAGFSARPLPERVALVASAWASDLPRLLIFDNCEDEVLLDDWMPKGGGCRLLITARRSSWSPARGITTVPLGRLTRSESLALLHRHRPDLPPDDPGLDGIAEELGDLPLALELAGSYLTRYRHEPIGTPAAYLDELRRPDVLAHASLTVEDPQAPGQSRTLTGHERDVARTFAVSLRRLQPDNPVDALALQILACAAWLAPGLPIPRPLLKLGIGMAPEDADEARRFAPPLERLLDLALLERASEAGGAVILHRLVAAFARARLEQAGSARQALEEAMDDEADRLLPSNDPTPFRDWAGHLLAVAQAAGKDRTDTAIPLLNAAGYYSMMVADFEASEAMLREATEQAQALLGPNHPDVARTLVNLGIVQRSLGQISEARVSYMRAVAILTSRLGEQHPDTMLARRLLDELDNTAEERRHDDS
jgi:tetratricopeptide (TPR) repeat protein